VRAWILSRNDLKSLRQQLKGLPGVCVANSLNLTTYDGGQAELSDGSPVSAATNSVFVGLSISLLPKVVGGLFELRIGATSTETNSPPHGAMPDAMTNFTAACQILISNGGGLVLDGGTNLVSPGTNYWIIISAVAVDAQGKPKRLRKSAEDIQTNTTAM
jgi:hypothetical protein